MMKKLLTTTALAISLYTGLVERIVQRIVVHAIG
jgi:hypothetical protein